MIGLTIALCYMGFGMCYGVCSLIYLQRLKHPMFDALCGMPSYKQIEMALLLAIAWPYAMREGYRYYREQYRLFLMDGRCIPARKSLKEEACWPPYGPWFEQIQAEHIRCAVCYDRLICRDRPRSLALYCRDHTRCHVEACIQVYLHTCHEPCFIAYEL